MRNNPQRQNDRTEETSNSSMNGGRLSSPPLESQRSSRRNIYFHYPPFAEMHKLGSVNPPQHPQSTTTPVTFKHYETKISELENRILMLEQNVVLLFESVDETRSMTQRHEHALGNHVGSIHSIISKGKDIANTVQILDTRSRSSGSTDLSHSPHPSTNTTIHSQPASANNKSDRGSKNKRNRSKITLVSDEVEEAEGTKNPTTTTTVVLRPTPVRRKNIQSPWNDPTLIAPTPEDPDSTPPRHTGSSSPFVVTTNLEPMCVDHHKNTDEDDEEPNPVNPVPTTIVKNGRKDGDNNNRKKDDSEEMKLLQIFDAESQTISEFVSKQLESKSTLELSDLIKWIQNDSKFQSYFSSTSVGNTKQVSSSSSKKNQNRAVVDWIKINIPSVVVTARGRYRFVIANAKSSSVSASSCSLGSAKKRQRKTR